MNDGVGGEDRQDSEPVAPSEWSSPENPVHAEAAKPEAVPPAAPAAVPPAAFPSGYPHWAAATPPPPPYAPAPPPPYPPAAPPWTPQDPWSSTSTSAWPAAASLPPRPTASRRTAAVAALLLFAAAAGASAGVVALTTHGSQATSSSLTTPGSVFQPGTPPGNGNANPNPGNGSTNNGGTTGPLDQATIESKLDPAIVDVTVTLAGGQGTAEGTGMVITKSGEVLTNNHVIDGAETIKVQIGGTGSTYDAKVVGYDVADDVALLQIQDSPSDLSTISTGDPSQLNVGDTVLALGNALGRGGTPQAAPGTVTALDQTITAGDPSGESETLSGLIETNANIQPGDSGGPLVDSSGQVVGMDTAASVSGGRFHRFGGTTGQGYAIPIDTAMQIVQQIRAGGGGNANIQTGQRALLGVEISGSGGTGGATVAGVQPGSPAESAGIASGDVITSVGGVDVTSAQSLQQAILKHKVGDKVSVVWDDAAGHQHSATVTLISGPPA